MSHFFLGLLGATGKLGQLVQRVCEEEFSQKITLIPLGRSHLTSPDVLKKSLSCQGAPCILLDVSLAEGTQNLCQLLLAQPSYFSHLSALVIGTTAHSAALQQQFDLLASRWPVCIVPNFSRGIYAIDQMLQAITPGGLTVERLWRHLGFDFGMLEVHHTQKRDAPSGTALRLAQSAHIPTSQIQSLRVGSIVGEHTLIASQNSEQIEIRHTSFHRDVYARGALQVCSQIAGKAVKGELRQGFLDDKNLFSD